MPTTALLRLLLRIDALEFADLICALIWKNDPHKLSFVRNQSNNSIDEVPK